MSSQKGTKPKPRNTRRKRKAKKQAALLAGCPSPVFSDSESPCLDDGKSPPESESQTT